MSIHKKKRTCPKSGKTKTSKNYFLKHRFDGDVSSTEISLKTSDKQVANKRASDFVQNEERKRAGLLICEIEKEAASRTLINLAEEYVESLKSSGCQQDHYRKVIQRLRDGFKELGWSKIASINKREFRSWIKNRNGWTQKTKSHYQAAFTAFMSWLHEEDYISTNPFAGLKGIQGSHVSSTIPTSLSEQEARQLLDSAPEYRRDFYALMLYTGLRAIEVKRLRVESVSEEKGKFWIYLSNEESKARRHEYMEAPAVIVPILKRLTSGRNPEARLIIEGEPTRRTFRNDLERAGIEQHRADGSSITKHTLRKTFITWTDGITESPAVRQRLARHTTARLTEQIYTDRKSLGLHDILDKLPNVFPDEDSSISAA